MKTRRVWVRGVDVSDLFEDATYSLWDTRDWEVRMDLKLTGWGKVFDDGESRDVRYES